MERIQLDRDPIVHLNVSQRGLYLRSPLFDGLALGGLGVFVWLIWTGLEIQERSSISAQWFWLGLSLLTTHLHFACSLLADFEGKERSSAASLSVIWFCYSLFMLVIGLLQPGRILPNLAAIALLCLLLHIGCQSYRAALDCCQRDGLALHRWEQFLLGGFVLAAVLYPVLTLLARRHDEIFFGVSIPISVWTIPVKYGALGFLWLCFGFLGLGVIVVNSWLKRGRFPPLMACLPLLQLYLWLDLGVSESSFALTPRLQKLLVFHSLQALYFEFALGSYGKPSRLLVYFALGAVLVAVPPWIIANLLGQAYFALPAFTACLWLHHAVWDEYVSTRRLYSSPVAIT
jgi:hypothetical protein